MSDDPKPRAVKFKASARELGCDEDEARWEARPRRVAKQKPGPEKPE
jgi:hypothetical protein